MFKVPEKYRITTGSFGTTPADGNQGVFIIPIDKGIKAQVIASSGLGWEHVSVVINENGKNETPTWDEMCEIKDLFWSDTDCVVQYHPPKSEYVNNHANCLHLWRPTDQVLPQPPSIMVGIKNLER